MATRKKSIEDLIEQQARIERLAEELGTESSRERARRAEGITFRYSGNIRRTKSASNAREKENRELNRASKIDLIFHEPTPWERKELEKHRKIMKKAGKYYWQRMNRKYSRNTYMGRNQG
jgi:hypothetical protein